MRPPGVTGMTCPDHRGVTNLVPTPVGPTGDYISNNNTRSDSKHHTHTRSCAHSAVLFCAHTNALRGNRVLTRCHHHSLQEAIIERKLIHSTDMPASFSPLRGLHIPGGWSVKLVDIFLVPINLWFDSLFLAVFFYCLLQTVGRQTVRRFLFSSFYFPVDDQQMDKR